MSSILVSLSSFAYWWKSHPRILQLNQWLSKSWGICDGFEIPVRYDEIDQWCRMLRRDAKSLPPSFGFFTPATKNRILSASSNSIHLEPLKNLPFGNEQWLSQRLSIISAELGIKDFTIHPDEVVFDRWEIVLEGLGQGQWLSIENMDYRKRDFQELEEIGRLLRFYPSLRCTFDICHWLELSRNPVGQTMDSFFRRYADRVSKIHFSVPRSVCAAYSNQKEIETSHFLYSHSGCMLPLAFFDRVSSSAAWVVEGVIPFGEAPLLNQELMFLQCLLNEEKCDQVLHVAA